MSIRIDAYTTGGILSGTVAWPGHLRDALEAAPQLAVTAATFAALDGTPTGPPADLPLVVDDVVIATSDEPLPVFVHAAWHGIVIEAGPYRLEGEMATLPGFDPGRALTRPTGEFVHLRDVTISLLGRPQAGTATYPEALVNRYLVDMVESDLMLGFFFPGARMEGPGAVPHPQAGATLRREPTTDARPPTEPRTESATGRELTTAKAAETAGSTEPGITTATGSDNPAGNHGRVEPSWPERDLRESAAVTVVAGTLPEPADPRDQPRNGSAASTAP